MIKILPTKAMKIEYPEEKEKEAFQLKELIDSNYHIFHDLFLGIEKISFSGENAPTTINITSNEELKAVLKERLPAFMADTIPQIEAANNGQSEVLYLKFLLLDKYNTVQEYAPEFANNDEYEIYINSLYSLAAAIYYTNQNIPHKMVDFIIEPTNEEKEKIIEWLNERHRYKLLNLLLDDQYQLIIQAEDEDVARDPYLKDNLDSILDAIQTDFINSPIYLQEDIKEKLPSLTKDELDELCMEFFQKIDPSKNWLRKYNEMKTERIVCGNAPDNSNIDWCVVPYGNTLVMVAPLTGTIRDFRSLIHEFAHYISLEDLNQNETISPSIHEFPSIVLETEAIKFLEEKGYSKEDINTLRIERIVWTEENILDVNPVLRYLAKYLKDGPITYEKEKAESENILEQYKSYDNDELIEIISKYVKTDYESLTQKIDIQNTFLLQFPDYVVRAYPYVISMYLAKKTSEKIAAEPSTLYKVVDITNNLKRYTPETIISQLDLPIEKVERAVPKEYIKKDSETKN